MSSVTRALDCSVMEEDWQKGQSYSAHWKSLDLSRVQRAAVTQVDHSEKHCEARRLLQRFLSGAISQKQSPKSTEGASRKFEPQTPLHIQEEFDISPKSFVLETKTTMKMTLPRFLG
ncbi:uncharacterized protein LOC144092918 [Stigmatopora argus]